MIIYHLISHKMLAMFNCIMIIVFSMYDELLEKLKIRYRIGSEGHLTVVSDNPKTQPLTDATARMNSWITSLTEAAKTHHTAYTDLITATTECTEMIRVGR